MKTDITSQAISKLEARRGQLEGEQAELLEQLSPLAASRLSTAEYVGLVLAPLETRVKRFQDEAAKIAQGASVAGGAAVVRGVGEWQGEDGKAGFSLSRTKPREHELIELAIEAAKVPPMVAFLAIVDPSLASVRAWATQHAQAAGCTDDAEASASVALRSEDLAQRLEEVKAELKAVNQELIPLYGRQTAERMKATGKVMPGVQPDGADLLVLNPPR